MASSNGKVTQSGTVLQEMLTEATFNMFLYAKVGHSNLAEMHGNTSDFYRFYRSASQSDWYFILATRFKMRFIYRTVTFRKVQLQI
jgi:hypothetical protein